MSTVLERVEELAEYFMSQADDSDELGRLTDDAAKTIREAGVVRMLQPKDFGGHEATPAEFFRAVLSIGSRSGSAGWVAGVVGVHPFELAMGTRKVQEEIWGEDPDTWIASPYAPFGRARPVEGGYVFNGRWPYSSGTDLCDWVVLGGMITDEEGNVAGPSAQRHFVLPRSDYEILHDTWEVVGLRGTGSKDVVIKDAFVPAHRVIDPADLESGAAAAQAGRGDVALYRMPFHTMFGATIAAGTLALTEGALASFVDYTRRRLTRSGERASKDPYLLAALGEAASDIQASQLQFFTDIERLWELAQAARPIGPEIRLEIRRNHTRAVRRAVDAVDRLMAHGGGAAMRLDNPMQRFWRDAHIALNHHANVGAPIYEAYSLQLFGHPLPKGFRL